MLVLALTEPGVPETVESQVAFHLAAGVDLVLLPDESTRSLPLHDAARSVPVRSDWEEVAAAHGASWLVEARAGEFWLPRGGSLAEVLAVVPSDVGAVQALDRRPAPELPAARPPRLIRRPGTDAPVLRGWFPVELVPAEDARVRDALRSASAGEAPLFPRPGAVDDPGFAVDVATWFEGELLATNALLDALEARVARLNGGLRGKAARLVHRARRRARA